MPIPKMVNQRRDTKIDEQKKKFNLKPEKGETNQRSLGSSGKVTLYTIVRKTKFANKGPISSGSGPRQQ